ncbi:hypothetical protein [uncultured Parabacteroides sp.]|uniref:hypothetical protein n=1 Tax=uncultured Parabacteroides sp. TaxID=512312 RepID=UPI0025E876A4|nr:hypothetical protein [uncultured Parabacteroides sp.]
MIKRNIRRLRMHCYLFRFQHVKERLFITFNFFGMPETKRPAGSFDSEVAGRKLFIS